MKKRCLTKEIRLNITEFKLILKFKAQIAFLISTLTRKAPLNTLKFMFIITKMCSLLENLSMAAFKMSH